MTHLCQQLADAAHYLEEKGMSRMQLSKLHHFSLKDREVTFASTYQYFSTPKDLKKNNGYSGAT
ncbi:MAG: hypothetical protein ABI583_09225 [Betaproteobacteria bacterium]